jgi:hypothetical protein
MAFALAGCATAGTTADDQLTEADKFRKCGETFETVYVAHQDHEKADALLWNAADCYRAARERTRALVAYDLLVTHFPDSRYAEDARAAMRELSWCSVGETKSCELDYALDTASDAE